MGRGWRAEMIIVFCFRNGFELPVECESFEHSTDIMTGKISKYKIKGITGNKPIFVSLDIQCLSLAIVIAGTMAGGDGK